jgi:hypothetical protein
VTAPDATAPTATPSVEEARELLDALYPGAWTLALVALCEPSPHEHNGAPCLHPGKRPIAPDWNGAARARFAAGTGRDEHLERAARHLARGGNVGLAIPVGALALDVDTGAEDVAAVATMLPEAPMQATARGAHFLVRCGLELPAQVKVELPGGVRVDLRTGGRSQIVADPSRHRSGAIYSWRVELPQRVEDLPELPDAIVERLEALVARPGAGGNGAARDWNEAAEGATEGARHDTLKALLARWRAKGATREELEAVAEGFAARCRPPMDDADVRALVVWAAGLADAKGQRPHEERGNGAAPPEPEPAIDVADLALDFDAIRARPRGTSPIPGLLPEEPCLVVIMARPKVAKTRLVLSVAQAASAGVALWPGLPALELGAVAVVEAEEPAADTVRVLDSLTTCAEPRRDRDRWQARLLLFARDRELDPRVGPLLRLDFDGLALLRRLARGCGLLVLDSLSRLKPPALEEHNNDQMTGLLDELQRIAEAERCYVLLVHHQGHADRDDAVSVGRGASAIAAVARCVWHVERIPGEARLRRLRVRGNAVPDLDLELEVAGADADPPGAVLYFRPHDRLASHPIDDLLRVGESITTAELARRLDPDGAGKAGRFQTLAAALRESWRRAGLVTVDEGGTGKATRITRVR